MSGEEKQFEFDGWLKDNELTQTTKESLVKAGFESERSLRMLSVSLIKKEFSKALNTGQLLLLQEAVESLMPASSTTASKNQDGGTTAIQTGDPAGEGTKERRHDSSQGPETSASRTQPVTAAEATSVQPPTQETDPASPLLAQNAAAPITTNTWLQKKLDTGASLSAADILALIQPEDQANQDSRSRPLPSGKPDASLFDPLSFPGTRVPGNRETQKWRDVRDYVSMTNRGCGENASDSSGTVRIGDVELAFKDKKVPIDSVSMSQPSHVEACERLVLNLNLPNFLLAVTLFLFRFVGGVVP